MTPASTTGKINLDATNDVTFGASGDVTTTSGEIEVAATDAITMTDGAVLDAGDDQIDLDADEDITLGGLTTTYTADDAIVVTSVSGGIVDGGDTDVDIVANTAFATVDLDAVTGIGSANSLETTIYNLEATNTTSGDIKVSETDEINLVEVVNSGTGLVDITAGGMVTVTTLTSAISAVNLTVTSGNIVDVPGGLITAGSASSFRANTGTIGTRLNPLNVNINGECLVWAGNRVDEISANLEGHVYSRRATERVEISEPTPPGLVIFNNHLMGGGNYGSDSANGSLLSFGYGTIEIDIKAMFDLFYARAVQPWGYMGEGAWSLSEASVISEAFVEGPLSNVNASGIGIEVLPKSLQFNSRDLAEEKYYVIRAAAK
ncbi:MAG: hypothetical protein ABH869_00820 [Candidatus Omnitrophota bacterium]